MKVSFDVKLQAKDLYRFNMYQTYTGIHGWISILLAVLVFIMAGVALEQDQLLYTLLYAGCGLLLLLYVPVSLWLRARMTMRTNQVFANTLHYELSEECIRVTQGEESGELPWNAIYKMIANKRQILIYSSRINAYIIPREQVADVYSDIRELAQSKLEKFRVRFKN